MERLDSEDIEDLLQEINKFKELFDKEIEVKVNDLERIATNNDQDTEAIEKAKKVLDEEKDQIENDYEALDEIIPINASIDTRLKELNTDLTDQKKSQNTIIERIQEKPEIVEDLMPKLEEYDKLCENVIKEMKEMEDLKRSVYEKVLKTQKSIKDRTLRTVKFCEKSEIITRNEIERKIMNLFFKEQKEAQSTDVCFLIDCTGSMGPHIANARDTILEIIDKIKFAYVNAEIRVAIVGYRDIEDSKRFEIFKFSDNIKKAKDFLTVLEADGGGDGPEDVNGGFQEALSLDWKNRVKSIIHIADAPCHGYLMNGEKDNDNHPLGYEDDIPWEVLIDDIKIREMNYLFLKVGSFPDYMFKKLKEIYEENAHKPSQKLLFEVKELTDDKKLFENLVITHVQNNIAASLTTTYHKLNHTKLSDYKIPDFLPIDEDEEEEQDEDEENEFEFKKLVELKLSKEIVPTKADWDNKGFFDYDITGTSYYIFVLGTLKDFCNNKVSCNREKVQLLIRKVPFEQGEFSLAYYCKAKSACSEVFFNMILKQPKENADRSFYFGTLKKNVLVILLAKEFNKAVENAGLNKNARIYFTRVLVIKVNSQYFLLEAFIPGKFEKYTNNFEYVNENVPLLTAFSHFCYDYTKGKYMVTDLQGCNNLLTDPVVHSSTREFAKQADLGLQGMIGFFSQHECNQYCKKIGLASHPAQDKPRRVIRHPVNFDLISFYKQCNYYFCNNNAKNQSLCHICKIKVDPTKAF